METLQAIIKKIEQPLQFASRDSSKNLAQIKNLGKSLLNLLAMLKSSLPQLSENDASVITDNLTQVFSDFDRQKLELRKNKLAEALPLLEKLKISIAAIPATGESLKIHDEQTLLRISDIKEALAKLSLPVQYLKGVGPKMALRFAAKKIMSVEDMIYFLPRAYEDRREIKKINRLEADKKQTIMGIVVSAEYKYYGRRRILEVAVSDNTAIITAKWFKGRMSYLTGIFKKGTKVIFTGNVTSNYLQKIMIHPDYEIMDENDSDNLLNFRRIVPVYSETEGLHQKYIRKIAFHALENYARY
ncbi:MAG TPA: hypothetical protein PKZ12_07705, partial [Smithellaceae bacterium]|nr:hypothetical protein [Smithellaceae bacterium]